jgi:hypothetical protein
MTEPNAALNAWSQGTDLGEALEIYSDTHSWNRLVVLADAMEDHDSGFPTEFLRGADSLKRMKISESDARAEMVRLESELKVAFLMLLQDGKLLAVGYAKPRLKGGQPEFIFARDWRAVDLDGYFDGDIDWAGSVLAVSNFAFQDIRVVPSPTFEMQRSDPPAKTRKSPGRPTQAKFIVTAFEQLRDEGSLIPNSLSANYEAIRQRAVKAIESEDPPSKLRKMSSKIQGLGDEAIRRAVVSMYERWQRETQA